MDYFDVLSKGRPEVFDGCFVELDLSFPAIEDLRNRAKRRMPKFAFEYLDSATGREMGMQRNREALDEILFMPDVLKGAIDADLTKQFMGRKYSLPFGIAPLGMSGMIWPGAERMLARAAAAQNVPYGLSTVAVALPEEVGPVAGDMGWYQFYPMADHDITKDILTRVKAAGFQKLVVTVDVPGESRRERQRRALISMPPKLTPSMLISMILHPHWSLAMAKEGRPRMKLMDSYAPEHSSGKDAFVHAGRMLRGFPDWDYLAFVRQEWKGDLIVKGIMDPAVAQRLVSEGADAVWVSNHSGRQLEAAPASITQLPKIRAAVGDNTPLIFDSGVSNGLDIMRALALGADYVMLGRAFHYGVSAFGPAGIDHVFHILEQDMRSNMAQIGVEKLAHLHKRLVRD